MKELRDRSRALPRALQILDQCWKVDVRLRSFYHRFEKEAFGPIYWAELSKQNQDPIVDTSLGNTFPVAFRFQNLKFAHICMQYWATLSILWSGMGLLYHILATFDGVIDPNASNREGCDPSPSFKVAQLPPLEHRTDVTSLAKKICQSLEFCMQDGLGGMGPTSAIFPLKAAIETLHSSPGCDRELAWAEAAMQKINGTGVRILNHLGAPLTDRGILPG